jgi:hypothetical protein
MRWVLKAVAGVETAAPARTTIDLEGRVVKMGFGKYPEATNSSHPTEPALTVYLSLFGPI